MFTGIIESLGKVVKIEKEGENLHFEIESSFTKELKIDESVSHNGICLTVESINPYNNTYIVTAIKETLLKTNLGSLKINDQLNLERAMVLNTRLDGHIVQGHVDQIGNCVSQRENNGSWTFVFDYKISPENIVVEKGSICINGISLTAFNVTNKTFEVAIIPYTIQHTNLKFITEGSTVNLEFDIIGKYVARISSLNK